MAIKVFASQLNNIKVDGIDIKVPQSKIDKLEKLLKKKFDSTTGDRTSIPAKDLVPFIVPVKFDKGFVPSVFRSMDYSYYLETNQYYPATKPYENFVCVTNIMTFKTEDKKTQEFEPWSSDNNVWKVLPQYGINAYWSQHYSRGDGLYVDFKDLAKALIIDVSVQFHGQKVKFKSKMALEAKFKKAVDKLFEQFPRSHKEIIKYIEENY